ncbi:DUF1822 family protein [Ancylothrix sp. C2]|nr:DUF1822 family protein [Ancylothrix sp. D3o]
MTFGLTQLTAIYPAQTWLEFSPEQRENAWQQAQNNPHSNGGRWRAFLNILCLNIFQNWLKDDPDFEEVVLMLPSAENLASIWEVVNGTAMRVGETRLVIIPTDESNLKEFLIPQEWVDIPSWAGDYYLPVQVNLDEGWLRVWGYTSYEQVRGGSYDLTDRTYAVEREDLIEDLALMWVAMDLSATAKPQVKNLPVLYAAQAQSLLKNLGKDTLYFTRLAIAFEQWGALLENDEYRKQLYERRVRNLPALSEWFETQGKELMAALKGCGWQLYQEVFNRPEFAFRAGKRQFFKCIELENEFDKMSMDLVIELERDSDETIWILPKLQTTNNEGYLPENMELIVFDEAGKALVKREAGQAEKCLSLPEFGDFAGTKFAIQVVWGESCISEYFVI